MKKVALIAALVLAVALVMPVSTEACLDCVAVDVPEPDGSGTFIGWLCWQVNTGWYVCTVDGFLAGLAGGCYYDIDSYCVNSIHGFPRI